MEFCDNNRKFVIPFDSVDLSLLPSLNVLPKLKENFQPIWDANNLQQRNENCYYEFVIVQKEDTTDCDTYCSSTDSSSYMDTDTQDFTLSRDMCYVCNIEVPSVCMSEHLSSVKHKTFLKIAEISLERVKKQMGVNYKSENVPEGFSFCDTCVTLIPKDDMVSHAKLKSHKNSELLDKLLLDLLKIYSEPEVADDESANASKPESKGSNDSRMVDNVDGSRRKFGFSKFNDGGSRSNEVPSKIITGRFDEDSNKNTVVDKSDLNAAKFTTVNGKLDVCTAKDATNGGKLDVVTAKINDANGKSNKDEITMNANENDGKIANKSSVDEIYSKKRVFKCMSGKKDFDRRIINNLGEDLNDYIRNLDNCYYKVEAGEENDLVVETKGGLRVKVTLENFHGLYPLGKRHMLCILCKKIDRDINKHIYSEDHLNNIKLPIDDNCIRELDDKKSHCIICNDTIEYPSVHALCNKEHEAKSKLSLMEEEMAKSEKPDLSPKEASVIEQMKLEENTKSDETVDDEPVVTRLYSEAAKEPRKISGDWSIDAPLKLTTNETSKTSDADRVDAPVAVSGDPEEICKLCYSSFNPADREAHNQSPEHKSNEAILPHHLLEYSSTHRTLKCKVCVTGFPVHCKIQHVSSPIHQYNYKKLLTVNNMTRTGRTVYCSTCVAYMSIGDEFTHLTSPKHKALIVNSLASSELVVWQEKATTTPHYCKVCLVNVPGDQKNVKTHEDGVRHKKNLALAEVQTKNGNTVKVQDKVSPVLPVEHRHVIRVTGKPSEVECRICLSILPNTVKNVSEHLDGNSHKSKVSSLEKDSIKLYREIYWCSRCDLQVPIGEQFQHISTASHTEKGTVKEGTDEEKTPTKEPTTINAFYLNLLKPSENKGVLSCQVCAVNLPNRGSTLRMHFDGVKHRTQLMRLLKSNCLSGMGLIGEFNCTICYCRFPSDNLLDHIERPRHVAGLSAPITPADSKPSSDHKNQDGKPQSAQDKQTDKSKANQNTKPNLESKLDQKDQEEVKVKSDQEPEVVKVKLEDCPCVVCDVILTASEANITVHNEGARHKSNLKTMAENRVKVLDGGCYCEACDIKFSRNSLNKHVAGPQHIMMLG